MDKQHILNEIKRTTKANGGVPLGIGRFYEATGIKQDDFIGKFWARWGDAVREAGFQPNEMQTAFDEAGMIEKFVELARELGRLPVKAEMQIKGRQDPSFPNYMTFYKRFGARTQRISKVLEYCRSKVGYEDVVALCETNPVSNNIPSPGIDRSESENFGFVYLMKSGRHYKIGRSVSVGQRERQLAIQLPEKVGTVHEIRTDDPVGIEAYWHKRFEAKRKNGEWFVLDVADVSAFKRRKFM
jgi:hypothetical protein